MLGEAAPRAIIVKEARGVRIGLECDVGALDLGAFTQGNERVRDLQLEDQHPGEAGVVVDLEVDVPRTISSTALIDRVCQQCRAIPDVDRAAVPFFVRAGG